MKTWIWNLPSVYFSTEKAKSTAKSAILKLSEVRNIKFSQFVKILEEKNDRFSMFKMIGAIPGKLLLINWNKNVNLKKGKKNSVHDFDWSPF